MIARLLVFVLLASNLSYADSCEERNDPATDLNLAIRELIEERTNRGAFELLSRGVSANSANACGTTLLHIAAIVNDITLAEALVQQGAETNAVNHLGQTPVFLASNWSSNTILRMLLEQGGDPNVRVNDTAIYNTALMIAAVNENLEGGELLLNAGADAAYVNSQGLSVTAIATERKNEELLSVLNTP